MESLVPLEDGMENAITLDQLELLLELFYFDTLTEFCSSSSTSSYGPSEMSDYSASFAPMNSISQSNEVFPINDGTSSSFPDRMENFPVFQKSGSKRQAKKKSTTKRNISLSVLQQYFSGSLNDATRSIGVCYTTIKRICRRYGISR